LPYFIGDILDQIRESDRALLKFQRIVWHEVTTRRQSKWREYQRAGVGRDKLA
jgi:hypothetical protein